MSMFAVTYRYAENSAQARDRHRPAHVEFLRGLHDEGLLYMSGPLESTPPMALLAFRAENADALAARLDLDPFAANGLIGERTITAWKLFFTPRALLED